MTVTHEISMLDLDAQHTPIREEMDAAISRVIDAGRFVLGDEVECFEREFAAYCEVPFGVGCASGTDALLLALMASDIGPGDEVICPAYSFFATASCIERTGARPVFADIDPLTLNICPERIREVARGCTNLRAILPVHLFGRMCEMDAISRVAAELEVLLIEDAAQAVGARDEDGCRAGSRSAMGCFSLYPTKNLGALGDAGIVTTTDRGLADRLELLRCHGAKESYLHHELGLNSRLDALQAAVLRVKLAHLESWTKSRQENAARYDDALAAAGCAEHLEPWHEAALPLLPPRPVPAPGRHVYHQYVVRVPANHRDALRDWLGRSGIATAVYYPKGLHEQPCFSSRGASHESLPATEMATRETIALPVHPTLGPSDVDHVVDRIAAYFLQSR